MNIDQDYQIQQAMAVTQVANTYTTTNNEADTTATEATNAVEATTTSTVANGDLPAAVYEMSEDAQTNKLTEDQLTSMKSLQKEAELKFFEAMMNDSGSKKVDTESLLTSIFGSTDAAYPPIGTTPEDAAAAIAEGGAYSVDAVSDRIIEMATYFANGDADKLALLKDAINKGFESAGMDLETGEGLPGISFDTYKATMSKFEELENQLNGIATGDATEEGLTAEQRGVIS